MPQICLCWSNHEEDYTEDLGLKLLKELFKGSAGWKVTDSDVTITCLHAKHFLLREAWNLLLWLLDMETF